MEKMTESEATLDGNFDADDLQAIAVALFSDRFKEKYLT